ncbi:hypothetical protein QAD02_023695 [Eretmocerus hayati]|uniref:Uncharacterized protein n=1 Tax=Eretmocerus hayati TaxID=131215 RepID=A0ACC2Q1G7_9HYME|nr:hypothetical protein QAD02_023695 [Eretmocerus hayati]
MITELEDDGDLGCRKITHNLSNGGEDDHSHRVELPNETSSQYHKSRIITTDGSESLSKSTEYPTIEISEEEDEGPYHSGQNEALLSVSPYPTMNHHEFRETENENDIWGVTDIFDRNNAYPENWQRLERNVGGIPISRHSFQTLAANTEVNDDIINAFSLVMSELAKSRGTDVVIFPTFLSTAVIVKGNCLLSTARWAWRSNLSSVDTWVLPLHIELRKSKHHWAALLVSFEFKVIMYLDSLHREPDAIWVRRLCGFIEAYGKDGKMIIWKEWTYLLARDVPSQVSVDGNSWDNCGVHLCAWIFLICSGIRRSYTEQDMNYARKGIMTILRNAHVNRRCKRERDAQMTELFASVDPKLQVKESYPLNLINCADLPVNYSTISFLSSIIPRDTT